MAVKFKCPKCGKSVTANALVGATTTCRFCNGEIVVPIQATEAPSVTAGGATPPFGAGAPLNADEGKTDETQEGDEEEPGPLLTFLATHLPNWGTSVVFHAAMILLCIFTIWHVTPATVTINVTAAAVKSVKTPKPSVRRPAKTLGVGKRVTRNPGFPKPNVKTPGRPSGPLGPISVVGAGIGKYGLDGEGGGGGWGGGGIFEAPGAAQKIVYIIDRSASMTDTIDNVKMEMRRSIKSLTEKSSFHVIFFSSARAGEEGGKTYVEMPTRSLVPATGRNRKMAFEFIDGVGPWGRTEPADAIRRAFALRPELIYLLTDGEFDREIVSLIAGLNTGKNVTVNTISFIYQGGEEVLKEIAKQNKGTYKFVSESDLEDIPETGE